VTSRPHFGQVLFNGTGLSSVASIPPALPRQARADPRRAPQLVDGNRARRRIGAPCLKAFHVQPETDWWEGDAEQEAFELGLLHRARTVGAAACHVNDHLGGYSSESDTIPPGGAALNTWLAQANPDTFDVDTYLHLLKSGTWTVHQAHLAPKMKAGDRIYVWRAAGRKKGNSGVHASGWLTGEPKEQPDDEVAIPLWRVTQPRIALRVRWTLDRVAKQGEVIQVKWLADDPVLAGLRILHMKNETNYLLTTRQADRLAALWQNTGKDWTRAESLAGLWAYHHTYGGTVSKKTGSPVALVAERIGRVVGGVYNKVMNFRSIDPRDEREGLAGAGATDRAVWRDFYGEGTKTIREGSLDAEFNSLWPSGSEREPEAETLEEGVSVGSGRGGQGFVSDARVRKVIEQRAMDIAEAHYVALFPTVENTANTKPYDLRCTGPSGEVRVEVKGSTGNGSDVLLTVGEVDNAHCAAWRTDLFLVSHIEVEQTAEGPRATGGRTRVLERWNPKPGDLHPVIYRYIVPE